MPSYDQWEEAEVAVFTPLLLSGVGGDSSCVKYMVQEAPGSSDNVCFKPRHVKLCSSQPLLTTTSLV